ncbi:hypothetical protein LQV05_005933 [Cryptococcus neoformans]|nr:siderophore iron transporter MirB [Cryptococcus neoformans var. grubii c45]OXB35640.1 siderophore iron transporter MirB [Cryptococcus neoformans var. grubii]OXC59779.1 siderophore iron transporter MirB [Cryptococcus neoformans var. grubii MW-RSA852]UOH83214.1 hypothetical protein LQV05_005933 [Cryptococcus neoformans]
MGFIQVLTNRRTGRATGIISASTTQVNTLDSDQTATPLESVGSTEEKKDVIPDEENVPPTAEPEREFPDATAQRGVQNAEAITLTWSRNSLIIAYAFMFLLYFVNAFQSSITGNLSAYIVSSFSAHSLIPTIGIVSNVMSAATYMPLAKALNLWDRSYGFAFMTLLSTIGLILSATCKNIYVYCASQVFYSIGFVGMIFAIDVITADTSHLKDRGLAYAFTSSPYIITAFAGSAASEHFYENNWRWGFGTFAIVLPIVAVPLFLVLFLNKRKAQKAGLIVKVPSGRTFWQSVWYYIVEFDVLGVFLLAAGLVLFLLPFSIASSAADEWRQDYIIAMLVVGSVLLILFVLAERFAAPRPFIPYRVVLSRGVIGAGLLDFTYQVAYYCWYDYFTSYLQVVFGTSISVAGYISSIFDIVSGVWLLVVGYAIRKTGYFRWLLMFSVPLYLLGEGLMIYFRKPGGHFGWIIFCQILVAFGGGTITICEQVSVLASASHNDAAAVLAFLGLFGYIGGAVGNSISGAIWTHTFPNALAKYLPAEALPDLDTIYEDLDTQLSFPIGSATRTGIIEAYAEAQEKMLIAGTAVMALSLIWIFVIKNINVAKIAQVKGLLF